ncbi:metalloprotease [Natronomonas sp. EA1]|uniref:metalloprotease n=1 Tax=Natronomonas sp. EA1 TaxID=3421655 RepID=UPI003EBE1D9E
MRFHDGEVRDLLIAWVALGVAFTLFVVPSRFLLPPSAGLIDVLGRIFVLSMLTVGVGFLLHELAHKVVAVQFGQVAAFRADYTMLALAIGAALAGFLFAAPGAVYHSGRITERENGLIAVAGPLTNVALVGVFFPFTFVGGTIGAAGQLGVTVNAALAAFNMLPFGPLDGKKVRRWSTAVFVPVFVGCVGLAAYAILFVGFPV